jgi:uncharacterized protein (TIGR00266 family)
MGDVAVLELDGATEYQVQKGGFFASTSGVEIGTKFQGLIKGLVSGEGFFVQKISGQGLLFLESFGAIHLLDIPAGEEMVVDNHHLVAWNSILPYTIEKASSGWISSATSGEAFVCRFKGPGKVLIQTRNPPAFVEWINAMLPKKN